MRRLKDKKTKRRRRGGGGDVFNAEVVIQPVQTAVAVFRDSLQRCYCLCCAFCVFLWCVRPHLYLLSELLAPNYPYVRILNIVAPRKISYAPTKQYGVKYQKTAVVTAPNLMIVGSQITAGDRHDSC